MPLELVTAAHGGFSVVIDDPDLVFACYVICVSSNVTVCIGSSLLCAAPQFVMVLLLSAAEDSIQYGVFPTMTDMQTLQQLLAGC
jgi:hypothetical protein